MKKVCYRFVSAMAAVCLSAVAPSASAQQAAAQAALSGFTWQLFDLNPDDGIAPSLAFAESIHSYSYATPSPGMSTNQRADFGKTARGSTLFDVETSSEPGKLVASVRAHGAQDGWTQTAALNDYTFDFTLSASTGVRFHAFAHAQAHADGDNTAYAVANMHGQLHFPSSGTWSRDAVFADMLSASNQDVNARLVGYLESDGHSRHGVINLGTYSRADFKGVSPVPEPHTYLMLFAGLALVGGASRQLRK